MVRLVLSFLVLFATAAAAAAEPADKPLWIAVGPPRLLGALGPLSAYRAKRGFETRVAPGTVAEALRGTDGRTVFLLLVGDDAPEAGQAEWRVPAPRRELYRWRLQQPPKFAADAAYGDRDGDGKPDLAVGRIPARTPAEVAIVVAKTLAYETAEACAGDLRLVTWAGAPGYGAALDRMATGLLVSTVKRRAPAWADRWFLSGDAGSALCGVPEEQPRLFCEAMVRGSVLNAVLAHANADAIFSMRSGDKGIWFHAGQAARWLADRPRPCAPLVLLACNCAEFDRASPSLAERLLLVPGGPAAVIGATTESHPLANYFTGVCLLKALDGAYGRRERLGEIWREAQLHASVERDFLMERILKNVEGKLEPEIDVAKLRRDQQLLYALLGDPALRLRLPLPLAIEVERKGDGWTWKAERRKGLDRLIVSHRARKPAAPPAGAGPRRRFEAANAAEAFREIAVRDGKSDWSGRALVEAGQLRFVATGPGVVRVAVRELER